MNKKNDFMKIRRYVIDTIAASDGLPIRFPPTRKLASMFGVSQPTALRAVQDLIGENVLMPCRGGGTVSRPSQCSSQRMKIFGFAADCGKLSYDIYYFLKLHAAVALELARRSCQFCTTNLYLESPSMLEQTVSEKSISGVILIAARNVIFEHAVKLKRKGFPVVSFWNRTEGISSFYVSWKEHFRMVLSRLFQENRTHLLLVVWDRKEMQDLVEETVSLCCEEFQIDRGQVIVLAKPFREAVERVTEMLNFGMKFDGVVFSPCCDAIYRLIVERFDPQICRIVCDETSVFDDLNYSGYVVRYDLESAAVRLVDDLIAQLADPARFPEYSRIDSSLCLYENGKAKA